MSSLFERRERGLKSVNRLQDERRGDRLGTRFLRPKVIFGIVGLVVALYGTNLYFARRELHTRQKSLYARQNEVREKLGSFYSTLVSKAATCAPSEAGAYKGDVSERIDFNAGTFAYLRLHISDATSGKSVESAAKDAQRDALASCFATGESREAGEPLVWPTGGLFRKTAALQEPFTEEIRESLTPRRIEFLEWRMKDAEAGPLAEAKKMFVRLQYLLLAIDEEYGAGKTELSQLQLEAHPVRVAVLRLADDRVLFRRKLDAAVSNMGIASASLEVLHALRRNATNCDVGKSARDAALSVK